MAAGLGFIEFTTGDVLSAAAANGYLASQTVMVFADAAARTSAITSPQEGMFSFLKDTNATQFYDGAAWVNLDTTGMVNPMTTTGDVIYSSSGTTPARLGIGTAGQVLTVNSGATAPEWAAPAGAASFKGASAYRSSAQNISNNTATAMLLDTELFDTDAFHSTVTNTSRFTIPAGLGGKYLVTGSMAFETNATGKRIMNISVNGSTVRWSNQVPGNSSVIVGNDITSILDLNVSDYVEFFVLQDSGGTRTTNSGSADQWFQIQYLGA
jgi:hypothetical protein